MKRTIVWLMIACMLTILAAAAEDGFDGYMLLDMCCVNAGTFAFAAQDEILVMKDGLIAARTQCKDAERIDCADGTLYALCTRSVGAHIAAFGGDMQEAARYELGWIGQVNGFAVSAEYAAVTATNMATYEDELYICDFAAGEVPPL